MNQDHKNVAPWTTKRCLVSYGAMMLRKGISVLSRDSYFRKSRKNFRSSADDHLASVHDIDTSGQVLHLRTDAASLQVKDGYGLLSIGCREVDAAGIGHFDRREMDRLGVGHLYEVAAVECASAAGEAIDTSRMAHIKGSIAGDNTLLIIVDEKSNVPLILQEFSSLMKDNIKE